MRDKDKKELKEAVKKNSGRLIERDSKTGHTVKEKHITSIMGTINELRKK